MTDESKENSDYFASEKSLLQKIEENLKLNLSREMLLQEYKSLGEHYESLLGQTRKLMKIGDSSQRRLIKSQNELQIANTNLQDAYQKFKDLSRFGQSVASSLDTKEILFKLDEYIRENMDCDIITIGIYEEDKNLIKYKFLMKNHKYIPAMVSEKLSESNLSSICILENKEILISNLEKEYPNFIRDVKSHWEELTLSLVYFPLKVENRLIGIFSVQSYRENAYDENHVSILRSLAAYIGIAIDNAEAYKDISKKNKQLNDHLEKIRTLNDQLENEILKSEKLLLNILPGSIAERLKSGENSISDYFPDASVLFADIVGFTKISANMNSPEKLVFILNDIFTSFDLVANKYKLEKIKTIGDCYMLAGGIPISNEFHLQNTVDAGLEMIEIFKNLREKIQMDIAIRVGIHCGPIVAGVIGQNKFVYDLWGDTVNIASRMESHGAPGKINCSSDAYEKLKDKYTFEDRGSLEVKGKGKMNMYFLLSKR